MAHEVGPSGDSRMGERLWPWLGIVVSPILLTLLGVTVLVRTRSVTAIPQAPLVVYSVANVAVVGLLLARLSRQGRTAIAPVRLPDREEGALAVLAAIATVFVFAPVTDAVASALGFHGASTGAIESTVAAAVLAVSAVVIAPVTEEVLYRGLALGALRTRHGAVPAVVGSSLLFGLVHVFIGGASAVLFALPSGLVYGWMRVRYENLSGIVFAHALNNGVAVAIAVGVLPDVVPG